MPDFARRLKQLRISHQLTQKQLATYLDVTQNAIFNWENGKREPNAEMVERIAEYFKVSCPDIMGWDNSTSSDTPVGVSSDKPVSFPELETTVARLGYKIVYGTYESADGTNLVPGDTLIIYPDGDKLYISAGVLSSLNDEIDSFIKFRLEELRKKKS